MALLIVGIVATGTAGALTWIAATEAATGPMNLMPISSRTDGARIRGALRAARHGTEEVTTPDGAA